LQIESKAAEKKSHMQKPRDFWETKKGQQLLKESKLAKNNASKMSQSKKKQNKPSTMCERIATIPHSPHSPHSLHLFIHSPQKMKIRP
jgi:hypothetical protein